MSPFDEEETDDDAIREAYLEWLEASEDDSLYFDWLGPLEGP